MCLEHVDVKTVDGFYIVETKGREEIQILDKNIAVKKWCEVVSKGTGKKWTYLYLREGDWSGKISDRISDHELAGLLEEDYPVEATGNFRADEPGFPLIIITALGTLSLVAALFFIRT